MREGSRVPGQGRPAGVRVVGGRFRGRRLETLPGLDLRPTSDRVKEALFSALGPFPAGARVVDCFAGTGALGIEALSRGAERVVFIDASRDSLNAARWNIEQTGFGDRAHAVLSKAESYLKKPSGPYDIVFLDPPYAEELQPLLELVGAAGILNPDSIVIAEHFKKQTSPEKAGSLSLFREARYGDTVLAFYALKENP